MTPRPAVQEHPSVLPTSFGFLHFTLAIIVVKAGVKTNHQNVPTAAFVQKTDNFFCLAICKRFPDQISYCEI